METLSKLAAQERKAKDKIIRELIAAGSVAAIGLCFLGGAGSYLRGVADDAKLLSSRAVAVYFNSEAMAASKGFVKEISAQKFRYPVEGMAIQFGSLEGKPRKVANAAFVPALDDPSIEGLACEQTTNGHIYIHTVESLDPMVMDAGARIKKGLLLSFCDDTFAAAGRASIGSD